MAGIELHSDSSHLDLIFVCIVGVVRLLDEFYLHPRFHEIMAAAVFCAGDGGYVGMQFNPIYNAQRKETGEWQQTYYAYPGEGYAFDCWTEGGTPVSNDTVLEDEYGSSRVLTAHFLPVETT